MPTRRSLKRLIVLITALGAASAISIGVGRASQAGPFDPPAPQTEKKAIWGPTKHDGVSMFPTYRDLGVGIYQTQAHWDEIAPERPANPRDPADPAYRWPEYLEEAISGAREYGIEVQLMIIGAPRWANGYQEWRWAPERPSDFGDFSAAIAKRYPSVHLWMIWGEPNRKPNFEPLTPSRHRGRLTASQVRAPRLYAELLDSSYAALKSVNPENLVIGGNTFTASGPESIQTYQWIRYLRLPDGSRPRMDMWGHNPFGFRKPNLKSRPSPRGQVDFSDLRRLTRTLDRAYPEADMKLFLSEWGVPIGFKDKDLLFKVRAAKGVSWIRAALRITRRWDRIYTLGWIHPFDSQRSSQGLLNEDGDRKPGYEVFKAG